MKDRVTITFQPEKDVLSLLDKAQTKVCGKNRSRHGVRSRLINDALRNQLGQLVGKREAV